MVHQTRNRHIQAVMNNLKFIILDQLATQKSSILDLQILLQLLDKQFFSLEGSATHLTWYNTVRDNALHMHTQHLSVD